MSLGDVVGGAKCTTFPYELIMNLAKFQGICFAVPVFLSYN